MSIGLLGKCALGAIIVMLIIFLAKRVAGGCGCESPGASANHSQDSAPMVPACVNCGTKMPKICPHCGSCDQCRAEDKCGVCQQFQRQISLDERRPACSICHKKPCVCPTASGSPILREPGVSRSGVFSDPVVTDI
jgi:hypothetical protein